MQRKALNRFFTRNAAFVHPFCRVPSFEGSRYYVAKIFQWYKIMSPRVEIEIHSVGQSGLQSSRDNLSLIPLLAFDKEHLKLYVHMSQIFSIWIVPFHVAPVTLTTALDLTTDSGLSDTRTNGDHTKYYITKQEDFYQPSEFIKFIFPHFGHWLVSAWHLIATFFCLVGVVLLWPIVWLEENDYLPSRLADGGNLACNIQNKLPEIHRD